MNAATLGGLAATGFIPNTTTQQASSNFDISGNGTAAGTLNGNAVNTTTNYQIGGTIVLSVTGDPSNLFGGISAGNKTSTGTLNMFLGEDAGFDNATGSQNTFVGSFAAASLTTGSSNTFVGASVGNTLLTSSNDIIIGASAGQARAVATSVSATPGVGAENNTIRIGTQGTGSGQQT